MAGPCAWTISYSGCQSCAPLDGLPDAGKAAVEEMAATYLWSWTGKQFGLCQVALRPCKENCHGSTFRGLGPFTHGYGGGMGYPGPPAPALVAGKWVGASCAACASGACSCAAPAGLLLPGPVSAVTEVLVDGEVASPAVYRLDGDVLTRIDGQGWPACQDLALAATADGAWQITYIRGVAVPVGGQLAAGVLACEMAKALCRDTSCALPQRVQTITRQGVTLAMLDPFTGIEKGHTGIWLIDSWVSSIMLPRRESAVRSVDVPRSRAGRLGPAVG